jgi:hypothetical protein
VDFGNGYFGGTPGGPGLDAGWGGVWGYIGTAVGGAEGGHLAQQLVAGGAAIFDKSPPLAKETVLVPSTKGEVVPGYIVDLDAQSQADAESLRESIDSLRDQITEGELARVTILNPDSTPKAPAPSVPDAVPGPELPPGWTLRGGEIPTPPVDVEPPPQAPPATAPTPPAPTLASPTPEQTQTTLTQDHFTDQSGTMTATVSGPLSASGGSTMAAPSPAPPDSPAGAPPPASPFAPAPEPFDTSFGLEGGWSDLLNTITGPKTWQRGAVEGVAGFIYSTHPLNETALIAR